MVTLPSYPDWRPSSADLSDEDLRSPLLIVVHYWAIWDWRLDQEMDARLSRIKSDYDQQITFRSCNTEDPNNRRFFENICAVPNLGSYFRGARFKIKVGLRKESEFREILDEWIAEIK